MNRSPPQVRIAVVLGIAGAIATAGVLPYVLALDPTALARLPMSPLLATAVALLQPALLCFLLGWAGLKLGAPLGLGAPWIAAWLYRRPRPQTSLWLMAAGLGIFAGLAMLAFIALFGAPIADPAVAHRVTAWKGLLASPYGGIVEEIELRLFVLSAVAWLLSRITSGKPTTWIMIVSIASSALLFGVGHLPVVAQVTTLTATIVMRTIIGNAIGGLVFGMLYWKRGLEHAMLAHFCADIVLHVAAPLVVGH